MSDFTTRELEQINQLQATYQEMKKQLARRIVGQEHIIDQCLIAVFSGGHCLLVGVPGLAKTLLISSIASLLNMKFSRIQFTPDLMPSDITGTQVISVDSDTSQKGFKFMRGPIFCNILLADEINRTPPKTQAALIEAMEEHQVSMGGEKIAMEPPFFVLATQNPIEQEGTYQLPFVQLDRFMFRLHLDYPSWEDEYQIIEVTTGDRNVDLKPLLSRSKLIELMELVRRVDIRDELIRYAIRLARGTRPGSKYFPPHLAKWIEFGASPRAPQYIIVGAKAWALLQGRSEVLASDLRYVAPAVLEHRIIPTYHAVVEKVTTSRLAEQIIQTIPAPDRRKFFFTRMWDRIFART